MYVDPITRQTFYYATLIECGNIPQNIMELDPDADDGDFYVLTPDPLKREPPQMFKPTQIKTTITPYSFTNVMPLLKRIVLLSDQKPFPKSI